MNDFLTARWPTQLTERVLPDDGAQAILKFTRRRQLEHRVFALCFVAESCQLDNRKREVGETREVQVVQCTLEPSVLVLAQAKVLFECLDGNFNLPRRPPPKSALLYVPALTL